MAYGQEELELTPFQNEYKKLWKSGKVKVPGDLHPESPDPAYYSQWANYLYGLYCNNCTLICPGGFIPSLNGTESLAELRLYGRGMQPTGKYQKMLDRKDFKGPDGKVRKLVNISWRTHRMFNRMREIMIDRIISVEHEPNIVATDLPSIRKKEMAAAKDKLAASPQSKAMFQQLGMMPDGVNEEIAGMTPADVDILNQLGGYQTVAEITIREAVQATLQYSNYSPEINRQLAEDGVDLGVWATEVVHDKATGKQMIQYVDPAGLIAPISSYNDCRDMNYAAIIRSETLSALRQNSDLTEEQLLEVVKKYKGLGGNANLKVDMDGDNTERSAYTPRYNSGNDQMQVKVMSFYFVALDVERYIIGNHRCGNYICDRVKRDSTLNRKDEERGKQIRDNVVQYVYKGKWVVGTNIVFNIGVDDIVTREGTPGAMRATLPVAIYRLNQPSVTSSCISAIDDLQIALYKKRHALTTMPPLPNVAIDLAIMEDSMKLGPYELSPLDAADIYSALGYFYFHSKSEFAGMGEGSQRSPIMPMQDNVAGALLALQNEINQGIESLRAISGVNEFADGTGNPKDVLNGAIQSAEQASNRSMSGLYTAQTGHYKSVVNITAKRYQSLATYGARDLHYLPVGSKVVSMLQLYPDLSLADLDISVKPALDNNSRQMLMQALVTNRDQGKVTEDVFLMAMQLIQTGQIERAQYIMAKGVQEKAAQDQEQQMAIMRQQSEAQTAGAQAVEQSRQATFAMQGELDAKQIVLQGEEDRKTAAAAHELKMKELQWQTSQATV